MTNYPNNIDGYADLSSLDDLRDAVSAIEKELGISPSGIYSDARSRSDILEARINYSIPPSISSDGYVKSPLILWNVPSEVTLSISDGYGAPTETRIDGSLYMRADGSVNNELYIRRAGAWYPLPTSISTGSFVAGGDLSGSDISQQVIGLYSKPLNPSMGLVSIIEDGYVLTWNNGDGYWEPAPTAIGFSASGDLSGTPTLQNVIRIQGNSIAPETLGVSNDGYVLTWNNSDGYWKAATIPVGFIAGGDLSGIFNNQNVIKINGNSVSTQILDASTDGYVLTYSNLDGYYSAKIIPVQTATGAASGDLSGVYPNPTVIAINNNFVAAEVLSATQDGYSLTWSNIDGYYKVLPKVAPTRQIISGTGLSGGGDLSIDRTLSVNYGTSSTTACVGDDSRLSDSRAPTGSAGGDLSNTYPNPTVAKINGNAVAAQTLGATTDGYILTYSNSDGYYSAKPAPISFTAGGDLIGTATNQTVAKINGHSVATQTLGSAQDGYVLTWDNVDGYYKAINNFMPRQYEVSFASGLFSTTSSSFTRVGSRKFDISNYPIIMGNFNRVINFIVDIDKTAGATSAEVQLYNITDGYAIINTNLISTSTSNQEVTSLVLGIDLGDGYIRNTAKQYEVQLKMNGGSGGDVVFLTNARLVITYEPPLALTSISPSSGTVTGGTQVELYGTGFTASTTVEETDPLNGFYQAVNSVSFVSSTHLTIFTSAPGSGSTGLSSFKVIDGVNSSILANCYTFV